MKQVAVFGGSFDPPHIGHVLAVTYVLSVGAADAVVVVPVFEHAFHKSLTSFDQRLQLVKLAFGNDPRVSVSDIERDLPRPNYTLYTVQALAKQQPKVQWRLLVGADVLHDIQRWHKFDQLCALAPLLVLGRAGVSDVAAPPPVLPLVSSSEVRKLLADYAQKPNTETREQLARFLPKAVLDHIHQAHLYGVF